MVEGGGEESHSKETFCTPPELRGGLPAWTPARAPCPRPFRSRRQGQRPTLGLPTVTCVFTQSKRIVTLSQSHHLQEATWNHRAGAVPGRPTPTRARERLVCPESPTFKLHRSFFGSHKGGGRRELAGAEQTGVCRCHHPHPAAARGTHLLAGVRGRGAAPPGGGGGGWGGETGGSGTSPQTLKCGNLKPAGPARLPQTLPALTSRSTWAGPALKGAAGGARPDHAPHPLPGGPPRGTSSSSPR